jgi:hypothetical protein
MMCRRGAVTGVHGLGESGRHTRTHHARVHTHTSVEEWATQAARGRWRRGSARERGRSAALLGLARACETSRLLRRGAATPTVVCHVRTGFLLSSHTCSDTISSNRTRCSC